MQGIKVQTHSRTTLTIVTKLMHHQWRYESWRLTWFSLSLLGVSFGFLDRKHAQYPLFIGFIELQHVKQTLTDIRLVWVRNRNMSPTHEKCDSENGLPFGPASGRLSW